MCDDVVEIVYNGSTDFPKRLYFGGGTFNNPLELLDERSWEKISRGSGVRFRSPRSNCAKQSECKKDNAKEQSRMF